MKTFRNYSILIDSRHQRRGSALIVTLVTLAVLAAVVSAISVSVSTTANVSLQAASWQEALMAAEAGADTAMASFRVALTEPQYWTTSGNALTDTNSGATAWTGWSGNTTQKSLTTVLRAASAGNTGMQTTVKIEVPSGWSDSAGQWYRVRSTGVTGISGTPRVGSDRRDSDLMKISLKNTRQALSGFPTPPALGTAQVARSIELIIKPLPSGLWDRAITAGDTVAMGAKFLVDSFDSSDPNKSTAGLYDPTKLHKSPNFYGAAANVASNLSGKDVNIGKATVYGNISCNTGIPKAMDNVMLTPQYYNNFFQQLVDIQKPNWSLGSYNATPTSIITTSAVLNTGPAGNPAKYVLSGINIDTGNTITFNTSSGSSQKYVEIWVTKDAIFKGTSTVIIPSNVYVTIYIEGKFSVTGSGFVNQSGNAANLSLKGIVGKPGVNPQWEYNSDADFIGTIYGPEVKFKVTGAANFYGAVVTNTVDFGGGVGAGFHFDEALLKSGGSTPRYTVASWVEDVR